VAAFPSEPTGRSGFEGAGAPASETFNTNAGVGVDSRVLFDETNHRIIGYGIVVAPASATWSPKPRSPPR